jgi:hypothetical protein
VLHAAEQQQQQGLYRDFEILEMKEASGGDMVVYGTSDLGSRVELLLS